MRKLFLPYSAVRNNSIKLAHKIYKDRFIPDIIYVSLRGGAYVGNIISEYFKIVLKNKKPVLYAAVCSHSYKDIMTKSNSIKIDGWTHPPENLKSGDKILFVDEIFDSGKSINSLCNIILATGINRKDLKIVVHDYKHFPDNPNNLSIFPDYYSVKHIIDKKEDDIWIHYLSHELQGLTPEELEQHYYQEDKELKDIFITLSKCKIE
ncbi:MAG: phosphoribosyltransferase [Spirochaetaceae bacterium]|nr:phosphoribosyltransferase [Spirochaetaceae bacterium]